MNCKLIVKAARPDGEAIVRTLLAAFYTTCGRFAQIHIVLKVCPMHRKTTPSDDADPEAGMKYAKIIG